MREKIAVITRSELRNDLLRQIKEARAGRLPGNSDFRRGFIGCALVILKAIDPEAFRREMRIVLALSGTH